MLENRNHHVKFRKHFFFLILFKSFFYISLAGINTTTRILCVAQTEQSSSLFVLKQKPSFCSLRYVCIACNECKPKKSGCYVCNKAKNVNLKNIMLLDKLIKIQL
jgi:hypothetical protein